MPYSRAAPYAAPFLLFMMCLAVESWFPDQHYVVYPFKIAGVAMVIAGCWRVLPKMTPSAPGWSVLIGIVGVVLWVGLDPGAQSLNVLIETCYNAGARLIGLSSCQIQVDGPEMGRDPFALYPAALAWLLFACRLGGITLVVPVMEELFWRGFLMRWLIKEDFTTVPLGAFQPLSFWITTVFFALVHGSQWPLGLIVGGMYGAWFVRTKSLGNIMLAHGVTNLLMTLYCLASGDWHFLSAVAPVHL